MKNQTSSRKLEHIKIALKKNTQFKITNQFENIELIPNKAGGKRVLYNNIDLSSIFLNKKISAPIFISGMTGGHEKTFKINLDIAKAAHELNIPMGLGSQRAMIEHKELVYTYNVKKYYDVILLGNIGAAQLVKYKSKAIKQMLEDVDADALCIHTNPAQEIVQPEGNLNFKNAFNNIKSLADNLGYKVILKEVGNGISKEVAQKMNSTNIYGIDTGGVGGTNWVAIELFRTSSSNLDIIREWGIPTAQSLIETRYAFNKFVTATGGIRSGLDVVKAICLGANACGIAMPILNAQKFGSNGIIKYLNLITSQIKNEMIKLNCSNIQDLRSLQFNIKDPLKNILEQRKININLFQKKRNNFKK